MKELKQQLHESTTGVNNNNNKGDKISSTSNESVVRPSTLTQNQVRLEDTTRQHYIACTAFLSI
jgi:hypothetical protein